MMTGPPKRSLGRRQNRARTSRSGAGDSRKQKRRSIVDLYKQPLKATRTGALFSAFPYPTKISPETIALFIATHTKPGDTVFDAFAGSGTTGIATLLCSSPTQALRDEAKRLGLKVRWGARRAVLQELSVLGSFVGQTLCNPPNPDEFRREAERVLVACERELSWMYEARDPEGRTGTLRYIIWSEVVECPSCGKAVTTWEGCVRRNPARINAKLSCPHCERRTNLNDCRRLTKSSIDGITGETVVGRVRRPVWIYGETDKHTWSRPVSFSDRALLSRLAKTSLPDRIPSAKVPWGDLYRSGYHQGITHLHHFYTRRNLIVFATLWNHADSSPLRDALRFWLLSYNASHATLMTRVVAKKGQRDLVVTSSQAGVLYISGLPVEKNLFAGLRRKLSTIHAAFEATARPDSLVEVRQGSCLQTDLPTHSVDYVFTDPPFGGNIPYAEVNFINEAWLGNCTDAKEEITISRVQGKNAGDYQFLLTKAFGEMNRLLKKNGRATVVFHSASSAVWNALQQAYTDASMSVEMANVLEKTQGSFKQVTTKGAVKGDPLLLLKKMRARRRNAPDASVSVTNELLERAHLSRDRVEQTPQRLYSRFVNHYLTHEQNVPLNADEFYKSLTARSAQKHVRPAAE
jgi:16S rRNA G966 N2-methylase RsmD